MNPARLARAGLLVLAAASVACFGHDYKTKPRVAVVVGDPIVQMAPADRFRPIEDPVLVPLGSHSDPPFRNEQVVGVMLAQPPRMYPIGLLNGPEVLNDDAGGVPYVVARCALTDLSTVLDRRVAGRTLTFENSGALWRDMLVMRDKETGTYWTPATGRALTGPLLGETLTVLPAAVTTAEAWRELYPRTVCLETGQLTAVSLQLRAYDASSMEGISGRTAEDRRYPAKETVYFVGGGSEALAFKAADVREKRRLQGTLEGLPVSIEWDGALRIPRVWREDSSGPAIAASTERRELPAVPIYWFALLEQYATVRTLP